MAHVINPITPAPPQNLVDQPNANPPALPLIPILQFISRTKFASITDGTSNTFLLGEKHVRTGHFGEQGDGDEAFYSGWNYNSAQRIATANYAIAKGPEDNSANHAERFGGPHPEICMFAFVDGSVRSLDVHIDTTNLGYLANRADGKEITFPY